MEPKKFQSVAGLFACVALPALLASTAYSSNHNVEVLASGLNVRLENGAIRCSIKKGTQVEAVGRHKDGERIQVRVPGCGSGSDELFVYSNFVKPVHPPAEPVDTTVDANGLSFRSAPRADRSTWKCSLNRGAGVKILGDDSRTGDITWVKVALNPAIRGCPETGYVAKFYLKPADLFPDLPMVGSEDTDCPHCGQLAQQNRDFALAGLANLSANIGSRIPDSAGTKVQRFIAEARAAAARCRPFASHVCARLGRRAPCGSSCDMGRSKGYCKQGVREAAERALGYTLPGGSALAARNTLESRMTRLANITRCADAPVGAVCLYTSSRHSYGHIEVKAGNSQYCSDFCAARPIRGSYRLIGVYYP